MHIPRRRLALVAAAALPGGAVKQEAGLITAPAAVKRIEKEYQELFKVDDLRKPISRSTLASL